MAKVSAHGAIIGTVEYITKARRYMSDGAILVNHGTGWKLHGKLKPGITPADAFRAASARLASRLAQSPALAAYVTALHAACGQGKRWKLHMAISMMPDDADGVWSEACDGYGDNVHMDVDEVAELCRLYRAAGRERCDTMAATMADPRYGARLAPDASRITPELGE